MSEMAFEAVSRHIKPGMTVFVNSNCGIPQELMRALVRLVDDRAFRTNPVTILMLLSVGGGGR